MKAKKQIKATEQRILELINQFENRLSGIEVRVNAISIIPIESLESVIGIAGKPADDRRGLDLLFDKSKKYRHVCPKCKHHLVNRSTRSTCPACSTPMEARPVRERAKRGHYKPRQQVMVKA